MKTMTNIERAVDLLYQVHVLALCGIKDESVANEIGDFLLSLPDRDKLNKERDDLINIFGIVENTQELNMLNYTHEQVGHLNEAMVEIYQISSIYCTEQSLQKIKSDVSFDYTNEQGK